MELKITKIDDRVEVECFSGAPEEKKMGYDEIISLLLAAMEGATRTALKNANDRQRSNLYDALDAVFGKFLENIFPEIDPEEFTLIDAAIVKAQDEIINDAFERNISLEEALEEYHKKAVQYVNNRRVN